MGFFSDVFSGVVKVALTPVAIVKDVVDLVKGEEANNTKSLLTSAGNDFEDALDDISGG